MQSANVAETDLNLLVALRALLEERHVTRAAARIGLTQPAMSHALARLRQVTGDPILVRTRHGMVPTPRAEAMAAPLEQALSEIGRLLAAPSFDPKTSTRRFHIGASDYVELLLVPDIARRVWTEAPHVDLRLVTLGSDVVGELAEGRADFAIGLVELVGSPPPRGIKAQKLMNDDFVCVVRDDHPTVKKRLSLDEFCALPQLLVAPRSADGSFVDTELARLGRRRRVALQLPHFLVAPHVIRETDLVLTLATRIADVLAPMLGLRRIATPIELEGFTMSLMWHERHHGDPAHAWMRGIITSSAKRFASVKKR